MRDDMTVPEGFRQSVSAAVADRRPGDLALLADECRGLPWQDEALRLVDDARARIGPVHEVAPPALVVVFTGHRIDGPSRTTPRFPASAEGLARSMIRDAVRSERDAADGEVLGIAGAASGGDLLFHEVCEELGVRSEVYLACPREAFVAVSVSDSADGAEWARRYDAVVARHACRMLGAELTVPAWHPRHADGHGIWGRANLWMLHNALEGGAARVTVMALWNGEGGDGPGGTEDMIRRAKSRGARTVVLDARRLVP